MENSHGDVAFQPSQELSKCPVTDSLGRRCALNVNHVNDHYYRPAIDQFHIMQSMDAAHDEALHDDLKKAWRMKPIPPGTNLFDFPGMGTEKVNHPDHYAPGEFEHYKVAIALGWDKDAFIYLVTKYLWRLGKKQESPVLEDLKKALWYLQRRIEQEEKK